MKINVLAIVAHPDDAEIGAGGLLYKLHQQGKSTGIIDMTEGELGSRGSVETRYHEADAARSILGLSVRENLKMSDGFFEETEENLLAIIKKIRQYKPDIVITNSETDRHPDHGRASKLVSRACFLSGLVKIDTELNNISQEKHRPTTVYHFIQDQYISPDFVINISDEFDKKMESITAYTTQFYNPNSKEPNTPISGKDFLDFIEARAQEFGRPCGFKYAEGFTTEHTIGVENIYDLF